MCLDCSQVSPRPFEYIFRLLSISSSLIQQFKLNREKVGERATSLFPTRDVRAAVLMRTMAAGLNGLIQGDGTPRECGQMLLSVSASQHLAERVARARSFRWQRNTFPCSPITIALKRVPEDHQPLCWVSSTYCTVPS